MPNLHSDSTGTDPYSLLRLHSGGLARRFFIAVLYATCFNQQRLPQNDRLGLAIQTLQPDFVGLQAMVFGQEGVSDLNRAILLIGFTALYFVWQFARIHFDYA
jgi:hypothetical protein